MKFKARCIKHLAKNRKWILESGRLYEAEKKNDNEIEIVNHYGEVITLSLREFKIYCIVI
jgi:hypothetical protein